MKTKPMSAMLPFGLLATVCVGEPTRALAQSGDVRDADTAVEEDGSAQSANRPPDRRKKLSDRVKAVQRKAFLKRHRLEVFPHFALDLNDPFFQHFIVGGSVGFHLADALSIEARGGVVVGSVEQSAIRFVRTETGSLIEDPPEFRWHADLDLLWAPLYGKVSLFSERILHFDTYLTVGPGVFATDAAVNPAVNVGIGQRYFLTDWLVARIELRDYIFVDARNGESDIQNLLVLGFALSGFFPTTFEYDYQ